MEKANTQPAAPEVDIDKMIDDLVQKADKALKQYMEMDQKTVDNIVQAM